MPAPRLRSDSTPKLFAQLKALPWARVPVGVQTREAGHGRKETRTVKALTAIALAASDLPDAVWTLARPPMSDGIETQG